MRLLVKIVAYLTTDIGDRNDYKDQQLRRVFKQ